jgi:type II secretory ATPase GspE/PulE/Tfp pilus assembly ATPase PilB-like protein
MAIYEMISMSDDFKDLIGANEKTLKEIMIKKEIKTLKDRAMELLIKGDTSIEEIHSLLMQS